MFLNDMSGCRVWGGQSGPHVAGVCCHGNVIVRVNIVGFCKDQNVIVNIKHICSIYICNSCTPLLVGTWEMY